MPNILPFSPDCSVQYIGENLGTGTIVEAQLKGGTFEVFEDKDIPGAIARVAVLSALGLTPKEMADGLHRSPATVRNQLKNLNHRLWVENRHQAVQQAFNTGRFMVTQYATASRELTPAEQCVLGYMPSGRSPAEIGAVRHTSKHTVRIQQASIREKFELDSLRAVVTMGYLTGYLKPDYDK